MIRFYLCLALAFFMLFTATLVMIHAQPYDDYGLHELGCPSPCIIGLRPQITTVDEAVKLLKTNKWVESYEFDPGMPRNRIIVKWNRTSPAWLQNNGLYGGSVIWIIEGTVDAFMLDTTLTLGDLQLIFGQTTFQKTSVAYSDEGKYLAYTAYYPQAGVSTTVWVNCDGKRKHISYFDIVYLGYSNVTGTSDFLSKYNDSWAEASHTSCVQN